MSQPVLTAPSACRTSHACSISPGTEFGAFSVAILNLRGLVLTRSTCKAARDYQHALSLASTSSLTISTPVWKRAVQ